MQSMPSRANRTAGTDRIAGTNGRAWSGWSHGADRPPWCSWTSWPLWAAWSAGPSGSDGADRPDGYERGWECSDHDTDDDEHDYAPFAQGGSGDGNRLL